MSETARSQIQWYRNVNTYLDYAKAGLMSKASIYKAFIKLDQEE